MRILPFVFSACLASLAGGAQSASLTLVNEATLEPPSHGDRLGYTIEMLDGLALIGASRHNHDNGSAFLYDYAGSQLQSFLVPLDLNNLRAETIALGTSHAALASVNFKNDGRNKSGIAFLYNFDGSVAATVHAPTLKKLPNFGETMGLVGDSWFVGAPNDKAATTGGGAVYLYDTDGNLLKTLFEPTPTASNSFGVYMDVVGDKIVIGSNSASYVYDAAGNLLETHDISGGRPYQEETTVYFEDSVLKDGTLYSTDAPTYGTRPVVIASLARLDGDTLIASHPVGYVDGLMPPAGSGSTRWTGSAPMA